MVEFQRVKVLIDELYELANDEALDTEVFVERAMELISDVKEASDALYEALEAEPDSGKEE